MLSAPAGRTSAASSATRSNDRHASSAGLTTQALPEASALHHELRDRASREYVSAPYLALAAEAAGHRDEALAFARRAWDEREPAFILHARHFPEYHSLRSDPRFAAILREMNET